MELFDPFWHDFLVIRPINWSLVRTVAVRRQCISWRQVWATCRLLQASRRKRCFAVPTSTCIPTWQLVESSRVDLKSFDTR